MISYMDFDFDLMTKLAKENPAEFARKRHELIENLISTFPDPEEGWRMQSEIDMERMRTSPGEKTYMAMGRQMCLLLGQISHLFSDIQSIASEIRFGEKTADSK